MRAATTTIDRHLAREARRTRRSAARHAPRPAAQPGATPAGVTFRVVDRDALVLPRRVALTRYALVTSLLIALGAVA